MKYFIRSVVVLCVLICSQALFAQDNSTRPIGEELKSQMFYGVGLQAGLFSGSGILVRAHFPNRMGAQTAFGVIKLGDNTYWTVGAEFQYSFNNNVDDHFYGLIGGGYYYASTDDVEETGNELNSPARFGFGVGYEWFTSRNLTFNITLPLIFFTGDETTILPIPQLALVYYFQ